MPVRVLILGRTGMLGHQVESYLRSDKRFEVFATERNAANPDFGVFKLDIGSVGQLDNVMTQVRPHYVVNCIGLIKQRLQHDEKHFFEVNGLFPRQLSNVCQQHEAKLVHISTDCVFSGSTGSYNESDVTDPIDLYGYSKLMGEFGVGPEFMILRTCIVGYELQGNFGLLEWFLREKKEISGFSNAFFSGITTRELSKIIAYIIEVGYNPGLFHVGSNRMSKFEFLCLVNEILKLDKKIVENKTFCIDRSLDCSLFQSTFEYSISPLPEQLENYL